MEGRYVSILVYDSSKMMGVGGEAKVIGDVAEGVATLALQTLVQYMQSTHTIPDTIVIHVEKEGFMVIRIFEDGAKATYITRDEKSEFFQRVQEKIEEKIQEVENRLAGLFPRELTAIN